MTICELNKKNQSENVDLFEHKLNEWTGERCMLRRASSYLKAYVCLYINPPLVWPTLQLRKAIPLMMGGLSWG